MMTSITSVEKVHILEFTDRELKEILSSAVMQMVRAAETSVSEQELRTLSQVIEKCSRATKMSSL